MTKKTIETAKRLVEKRKWTWRDLRAALKLLAQRKDVLLLQGEALVHIIIDKDGSIHYSFTDYLHIPFDQLYRVSKVRAQYLAVTFRPVVANVLKKTLLA